MRLFGRFFKHRNGVKRWRQHRGTIHLMGKYRLIQTGLPLFDWSDLSHWLLTIGWPQFLGIIGVAYVAINFVFAIAYSLDIQGIANTTGSFSDAFFFSVQTIATIGYGAMYPKSSYVHLFVMIEALVGMLWVAMATGLMLARFMLPTARVMFSKCAVICNYNGIPTLMFRAANQRSNFIVEAVFRVSILKPEVSVEGHVIRRLHDLKLIRAETPVFSMSMTVMHPIDQDSPLYGITYQELTQWQTQIVVMLTGLDETLSQNIHASHFYAIENLYWNRRFVDVIELQPNGDRHIDYTKFHQTIPTEETYGIATNDTADDTASDAIDESGTLPHQLGQATRSCQPESIR
jgi:inward rectifier potassium channel